MQRKTKRYNDWKMIPYKEQEHKYQHKLMEEATMATIKEEAKDFKPMQTKNIADLDKVDVSLDIQDREGTDKDDNVFKYKVVVVGGEDYRIPNIVIGQLKSILEKKSDLKTFSVSKTGTGLSTQYTVIPMD